MEASEARARAPLPLPLLPVGQQVSAARGALVLARVRCVSEGQRRLSTSRLMSLA